MNTDQWFTAQFASVRPKAIAFLTRYFRDVELAEEAFAISCLRALKSWPETGLPQDPLAWLLTVGRNAGRDILRKQKRPLPEPEIEASSPDQFEENYLEFLDNAELRDDILRLLFICCHPALSSQDQSALALRIVTGMSVREIAAAFLVKTKTMEQRITRAKQTIKDENVPFETPDLMERTKRLNSVMLMLYLLFNEGWSASSGEIQIKAPLCEEAIRLGRLLLNLFPGVSELMGLLALFLNQHARYAARLDGKGKIITLEDQDRTLWNPALIKEAAILLEKALRHASPGSYQVQAAIAGVHARSKDPEGTDWHEIDRLYSTLYLLEPTAVVKLNHASVVARIRGPKDALDMLTPLSDDLKTYRWYHAAIASFHFELADFAKAKIAYQHVLNLDVTAQEKIFIDQKIAECEKKSAQL